VNVVALHAANPGIYTGAGNWTYLIPGSSPVLVDAGVGRMEHLEAVAAAAPTGPARVVVSHAHPDHASGVPAIAARWPSAAFHKVPWVGHDEVGIAWTPMRDGEEVQTGEGPLQVLHTPGHAPDHIALWHADSRTLFGADLMQAGNTVAIPAENGGDLSAYLRSLQRVRALAPARVLPAHGPAIEDPLALIDQYLTHRHQREAQILGALEAGLDTAEAIAERLYAVLAPQLRPLGRQSVLAHLIKLEQEGRARRAHGKWVSIA
jgi:glyoxylase-like metal-dependent hydrolase (beta-lactamase superfamily II)